MTVDIQQRIERIQAYLASDPGNVHLLAEIVPLALKSGQPKLAEAVVAAALLQSPADPGVRFQAGILALAQSQWDTALDLFSGLLSDGQEHPAIRYNAAYAALRQGAPGLALDLAAAIKLDQQAEVPELRKLEGQCLHHLERGAEAVEKLLEHTAKVPNDAEGWGLLALMAADEGRDDLATAASARAFALDADSVLPHVALGSIALDAQEADAARRHFAAAVERHPGNGRAWSGLAFAQSLRLELDEAELSFAKAVEYMPNHIGTWHGLAWLQILRKDFASAKNSLQKAMDIDRNFADTHGSMAVVSVLEGRDEEARLEIRRALGLNKDCASGLYAQSLLLAKQGQSSASVDELLEQISASLGMPSRDGLRNSANRLIAEFGQRGKQRSKTPVTPRTLH